MKFLCEYFRCETPNELNSVIFDQMETVRGLLLGAIAAGYYTKKPFLIRVDEVTVLSSTESMTKSNEAKKKQLRWPYWPRLVQHGGLVNKNRLDRSGMVHKSFFPVEWMYMCPANFQVDTTYQSGGYTFY